MNDGDPVIQLVYPLPGRQWSGPTWKVGYVLSSDVRAKRVSHHASGTLSDSWIYVCGGDLSVFPPAATSHHHHFRRPRAGVGKDPLYQNKRAAHGEGE